MSIYSLVVEDEKVAIVSPAECRLGIDNLLFFIDGNLFDKVEFIVKLN